jgi:hypothetical protein
MAAMTTEEADRGVSVCRQGWFSQIETAELIPSGVGTSDVGRETSPESVYFRRTSEVQ